MISDFLFKKLGRLIHSEESDGDYEIHERFADRLLDAGYIEYLQWNEPLAWGHMHCVKMISTEKGREAYLKWQQKKMLPITSESYSQAVGKSPSECNCTKCQQMCHAPCCGSVDDFEKLIDGGYANRLMFDDLPSSSDGGDILKPALKGYEGKQAPWETASIKGCTFWKKGKCELHKSGLKPIQGKIATHEDMDEEYFEKFAETSKIDWESDRGLALIERWKKLVNYQKTDADLG